MELELILKPTRAIAPIWMKIGGVGVRIYSFDFGC